MSNKRSTKNKIRSALTGKIINGRDVILTTEAIDYVKKMGYIVARPNMIDEIIMSFKKIAPMILMIFSFLFTIPLVSAQPAIFVMDLSQTENQVILSALIIISGFFYIRQAYWVSGIFLLVASLLMIFNGINIVACMFFLALSLIIISMKGEK